MEIRLAVAVCLFSIAGRVLSDPRPIDITWNTGTSFGPDGPWQAVQAKVGTDDGEVQVSLYPGGSFDSEIITTNFCNGTTAGCVAANSGLYDPTKSPTADFQSIGAQGSISSWGGDHPMNLTGQGVFTLDTMTIGSDTTAYPMPKTVFSAIVSTNAQITNGSFYPVRLGNLALGSPNPVQTFLGPNNTNVTGNLLTGYLRTTDAIPSSSFGLHIGSVPMGHQGSLILGGYDKSRVLGNVGTFDTTGTGGTPILNMIDATIGVEVGGTPFNTTNIGSLYRAGGNTSVPMNINPLVPYMFLPFGMCEAIAEWLPVTYQNGPGLYTWNTHDYRYKAIVSSPAYLSFTFEESTSSNLTIKVPFSLLNLTLESPLVATPQPYFPCKPFEGSDDQWYLGRAFLQAAYLSVNWEQNKFFLAQASGPGSGPSSISPIQPSDDTIVSGPDSDFLKTWNSKWVVLPSNTSSRADNTTSLPPPISPPPTGLSTGAIAGIAVGIGAAALIAIIAVVLFCLRRRRRRQASRGPLNLPPVDPNEKPLPPIGEKNGLGQYKAHYRHEMEVPPAEMFAPRVVHEANGQTMIHEAPSTNVAYEIDSHEIGRGLGLPRSPRPPLSKLSSVSSLNARRQSEN